MPSTTPRETLKEMIETNGDTLLQDPDRCEGLLKDLCAGNRREISAIMGALEERVPLELRSSWQSAMTPEAMRSRLVQRLEDNRGLAPQVANWAVDTWSYALGVPLPSSDFSGAAAAAAADVPRGAETAATSSQRESSREFGSAKSSEPAGRAIEEKGQTATGLKKSSKWAGIAAAVVVGLLVAHAAGWLRSKRAPSGGGQQQQSPQTQPSGNGGTQQNQPGQSGQSQPEQGAAPSEAPHSNPPRVYKPSHLKPSGSEPGASATPPPSPFAPLALPAGTTVMVRLDQDVDSSLLTVGGRINASLAEPVTANGEVVLPAGAPVVLRVASLRQTSGDEARTQLRLTVSRLGQAGQAISVSASKTLAGPTRAKNQTERGVIGAGAGAVAGFITGHLFHHGGAGAAAGGGTGAAVGVATSKVQPVKLPAEEILQFRLSGPAHLQSRF